MGEGFAILEASTLDETDWAIRLRKKEVEWREMRFSEEQIQRYSRQMILPGIGGRGQRKLAEARVFIMGAGGLGSPSALYLAAAGVGTIGLADFDRVELHNLQRQILHRTEDLGCLKVESGKKTLESLNPEVKVKIYPDRVTSANIREIIRDYNLVLDGSDNFPTRFLVNDACFYEKKTLISGAILRFDGQLSTFKPHAGEPCYRCLFPEPPPPGTVPSCQEAGILGAVAGIIGLLQANEALKEILGIGKYMAGRLLLFNALNLSFSEVKVQRNPGCLLCGENPTIKGLMDYSLTCQV
jgi:adenylyltransferase/sulfurtransferase